MKYIIILTMFALSSCGKDPLKDDYDIILVADYWLSEESSHNVTIKHWKNYKKPGVDAKVVEVAWSDKAIIAKRQHLKARGLTLNDRYMEPVPGQFDFWIIDVVSGSRLGPMSETEFKKKISEENLVNLELKNPQKYRY